MPGVKRSLHPTHSVAAIGSRAEEITSGHELCSTPCGIGSPYEKILQDGQILFLGATLDSNTAFHSVEALANLPYLLSEYSDDFTIVREDGTWKDFTIRRHKSGLLRRFSEWEEVLLANKMLKAGQVGGARSLLLEGKPFLDFMLDVVARDPSALLQPSEKVKAHA